VISGVARVPTPGGKAIFAPPLTKTAEFEVKNIRRKRAEEANGAEEAIISFCYFCLFFEVP